jgi:hypothetical protein
MMVRCGIPILLIALLAWAVPASAAARATLAEPDSPLASRAIGTVDDIASGLLRASGGSVTNSLDAINRMRLGQDTVISVLQKMYSASGRGTAGVQRLADGTQVLLSRRVGASQAVLGISRTGQVRAGTATIEVTGDLAVPLRATNISF